MQGQPLGGRATTLCSTWLSCALKECSYNSNGKTKVAGIRLTCEGTVCHKLGNFAHKTICLLCFRVAEFCCLNTLAKLLPCRCSSAILTNTLNTDSKCTSPKDHVDLHLHFQMSLHLLICFSMTWAGMKVTGILQMTNRSHVTKHSEPNFNFQIKCNRHPRHQIFAFLTLVVFERGKFPIYGTWRDIERLHWHHKTHD